MEHHTQHPVITGLKGALRYVRAYRGSTFVLKLGGEVLADGEALEGLAGQMALLSSIGIRLVVVHGGGPQVNALSRRLGFEPKLVAGRRVTDAPSLEAVKMVCGGSLNLELVGALVRHGVHAVGLSGVDAGTLQATRRAPLEVQDDEGRRQVVDFGFVGDIQKVDPALLLALLDGHFVPVLASLAGDADGHALNVNADTVAESVARALKAEKLIFLTGAPGVMRNRLDPKTVLPFASPEELRPLLDSGAIAGGMRPKVEACIRAATGGVARTHIVDGRAHDALLVEVFTGSGSGTMIVGQKEKAAYEHEAAEGEQD